MGNIITRNFIINSALNSNNNNSTVYILYFSRQKGIWKMKSWIKNIIKWYKDRDCKYFVIKIEDLAKACESYSEFMQFQYLLDKYNNYRKSLLKPVNTYFVMNRDEFPQFKNFEEFNKWIESCKNGSIS